MNDKYCGKIIDYINDQLTDKEKQEFEKHLNECPDCQEELQELEDLMGDIPSYMNEVTPPPGMRERVLDEVFSEEDSKSDEPLRIEKNARTGKWKAWAGALAAGLLLSIGVNVFTGIQLNQLASQNEKLESNLTDIQVALSELQERQTDQSSPVKPSQRTQLASTGEGGGEGLATLIERKIGQELLIQVQDLAQLEGDEVYQVWLIDGETPEPAGSFMTDASGNGAVTFTLEEDGNKSWDAIAVSKEPQPNNTTPQGDIVLQSEL
ncbi:anti-sigma factor [Halobacillus litoralis]|uniref:anti-sigma factor n=1 Tax=Halobacillus litoralis TaxID=45668 RepID=UPI001CFF22B4|nr:anti-sigma factor [Halobacillus litoralis]